jgi:predicted enzyme related to lactoylglutathione lyase
MKKEDGMLQDSQAYSGFSVKDMATALTFYKDVLGLDCSQGRMGLELKTNGNNTIYIYEKSDHKPAEFTILNFPVSDINAAVEELKGKGVVFESYDFGGGQKTDDHNVMRGIAANMGPDIAWFKDPAGNIISVLQNA